MVVKISAIWVGELYTVIADGQRFKTRVTDCFAGFAIFFYHVYYERSTSRSRYVASPILPRARECRCGRSVGVARPAKVVLQTSPRSDTHNVLLRKKR